MIKVLKFGGTSVATPARLLQVAGIVGEAAASARVVVVVSALAGVTDELVRLVAEAERGRLDEAALGALGRRHRDALRALGGGPATVGGWLGELRAALGEIAAQGACDPALRDRALACGERLSTPLTVAALRARELDAVGVDAIRLIATDGRHGEASVDQSATRERAARWWARLPERQVPVVTGFLGRGPDGAVTTLGRGGSDLSASVLGAALGADLVEIWTDVEGVLTAPPRLVADASTIPEMGLDEAAELAALGAKVLHPRTLAPLEPAGIPARVRCTFSPHAPGTRIIARGARPVRALAVLEDLVLVRRESGVALLDAKGRIPWSDEAWVSSCLVGLAQPIEEQIPVSLIALVGNGVLASGIVGSALALLARRGIVPLGLVRRSGRPSVGLLVRPSRFARAALLLHDHVVAPSSAAPGLRGAA